MLLNDKDCERHFAINALEYGNDLDIVGWGTCLVMHPHSTLSLQHWAEPRQNDEVENTVKYGTFRLSRATEYTDSDGIRHINVERGCTLAYRI